MAIEDRAAEYEDARRQLDDHMVNEPLAAAVRVLQMIHTVASRTGETAETAETGQDCDEPTATHVLCALILLRHLREELADWEPQLIAAARDQGVSWAQLAPALGVASRQAAERRYLRLRPAETSTTASTRDQRVQAERDRRASDRAVTEWARRNSALLRRVAGQIGALDELEAPAQQQVDLVNEALAHDDAARLLPLLAESRSLVWPTHPHLAEQIDAITQHAERLRHETTARRRALGQEPT